MLLDPQRREKHRGRRSGMARQLSAAVLRARGRHCAGQRRGLSALLLWCCASGMLPWIVLSFLPHSRESSSHPSLAVEDPSPLPANKGVQ